MRQVFVVDAGVALEEGDEFIGAEFLLALRLILLELPAGDDELFESELTRSLFQHLAFDRFRRGEAIDVHGLRLTDSVHAIHRL